MLNWATRTWRRGGRTGKTGVATHNPPFPLAQRSARASLSVGESAAQSMTVSRARLAASRDRAIRGLGFSDGRFSASASAPSPGVEPPADHQR